MRIDQEQRCSFGAFARVGDGCDDHEIGVNTVCDEDLRAVEYPLIAVSNSVGSNSLHVGTCTGLGHGKCTHDFTGHHAWEPMRFLSLCTVSTEVGRNDV